MSQFLSLLLDALLASIALVPILWLLHKKIIQSKSRSLCYFALAFYLCGVYAVVGLPNLLYVRFDLNVNLVPFAYMFSDYRTSLLNVILFMPLGFFLPFLWIFFKRIVPTILFGFLTSLLIEVLQIFTYRATDINDLMTNTFGTFLGWLTARILLRLIPGISPSEKTKELPLICGISFSVMFFLHPFLSAIYWAII